MAYIGNSHPDAFCKRVIQESFGKFTKKHLQLSSYCSKVTVNSVERMRTTTAPGVSYSQLCNLFFQLS